MPLWLWIVLALLALYGLLITAGFLHQTDRPARPVPPRGDTTDGLAVTGGDWPAITWPAHADGTPMTPDEIDAAIKRIGDNHRG